MMTVPKGFFGRGQDGIGSEICNQAGETFWPQGGGNIMALVGESFWPCRGKHYGPGGGIILALHGGNIMALAGEWFWPLTSSNFGEEYHLVQ